MILLKSKFLLVSALTVMLVIGIQGRVYANFTFQSGETFILSAGETLNIDGNLTIEATGTLDAAAADTNIILTGNWTNNEEFVPGTGSTVTFQGADASMITGDNTFYNFACTTASKQINFTAGSTQTVNGTFNLNGQASGTEIALRSTVIDSKWFIQVPSSQTVSYIDVKDSAALVNQIRADDSISSGGNTNWFFPGAVIIMYPADGSIVGPQSTVRGTADPGSTVEVYGLVGTASTKIGQTTSDINGNWRLEQSDYTATLDTEVNALTARVGAKNSNVINITVAAAPTFTQVPQITSPIDGGTVAGARPVIEGSAQPGQTVTLEVRDENGNLLLSEVATTTSAADGSFTINAADYVKDLVNGKIYASVIVNEVMSNVAEWMFADPFGVVFASETNDLIAGAVVTLYYDNDPGSGRTWIPAVRGIHFDDTAMGAGGVAATNPQTTAADGYYAFTAIDGDYYIDITPPTGYVYPSAATTFPADRAVTTGSKGEIFTIAGVILEIDHPVDSSGPLIRLTKEANTSKAVVGDIITYTVTMENISTNPVAGVTLEDIIPAGFKYIKDRAMLEGAPVTNPAGTRPLSFDIGTISVGQTKILSYQLVVGSGVGFGDYTNVAQAKNSADLPISNTAKEAVTIIPDPLFDQGTVIGKVFHDCDGDGRQGEGEEVVGGAKIYMEDGTVITTDKNGMYHLQGLMPGRHLFKIDLSTVPAGTTLTTEEAVVVDVTKGLMRKVNFGLKLPEGVEATAKQFHVTTETGLPKPRLNVAMFNHELLIKGDKFEEPAQFRIFTNYQMFIDKWTLEILDEDTRKRIVTFNGSGKDIFVPVEWDGIEGKSGLALNEHKSYVYRLTVTGAGDKKDVTNDRTFTVRKEKESWSSFDHNNKKTKRQLEKEYGQWLDGEIKKDNLKTQTIEIAGQTVNISDIKAGGVRIEKDGLFTSEVSVMGRTGYKASDLLAGRTEQQVKAVNEIELIMPNGEYRFKAVGPGGQSSLPATSDIAANGEILAGDYSQNIKVGDDYLFLVALGDAKAGYNINSSHVETVNKDDAFEDGLWTEGRLAFYLKGKIKGKYLLTASFDSDRDRDELFRNLDPDKYYPVYGDESSVNYANADTQGMLYLLVEWDKSSVLWGNYDTDFGDTEFAAFHRTLYGGKVHLESVSTTQYDEPRSKWIAFSAETYQKAARNEFLGTGGSLYYLKHKDIIEGSDKVQIETRDKVTGLVLSSKTMQEGIDYEIDYDNGRITFWQPVSYKTASDSIISDNLLDGNPVYVVVDYEYETLERFSEETVGARVQQAIGDHITVGGTYVEEDQTKETYELKGVDTTFHLGDNIELTAEYAESESEATGSFISTDGGLNFTELPTAGNAKGKAYGVKGKADLLDNKLGLDGYYKKIEQDFSNSSTSSQQGKEMYGVATTYDVSDKTQVKVSHDVQMLLDGGNNQTELQVGATETQTTEFQVIHTSDQLKLTGELRHQEVAERLDQYQSETNREEDILAARADYKLTEKALISVEHQQSTEDGSNNQTTFGVETKLSDNLAVRAEETISPEGTATSVGITSGSGEKFAVSADVGRANYKTGGSSTITSVSADTKLDEKTDMHTTFGQTSTVDEGERSSWAIGTKRKVNDEWSITSDRTFASSDDEDTVGSRIGFLRDVSGRAIEGTFSKEFSESPTEASNSNIFGLSGDIDDNWAFSASYERGKVQHHDSTRSTRNAAGFGLGFVDKDEEIDDIKLKASIKGELRLDEGDEDTRQYLIYTSIEGKVNPDTTIFAKANLSQTKNTTLGTTDAMYKEFAIGGAYRPIEHDWLNLIGKYTYLDDDAPVSQSDISGVDQEKAHVLAGETVIDLNEKWQLSQKIAYKTGKQKVEGFDFTKTSTWLWISRVGYKFKKDWMLSSEYRLLNQEQADDRLQGALIELSRKLNKSFEIGLGYNFSRFSDDLAHLDYKSRGPFIRITGKF